MQLAGSHFGPRYGLSICPAQRMCGLLQRESRRIARQPVLLRGFVLAPACSQGMHMKE